MMAEQQSGARSIDMTLRIWSDHVYLRPFLTKMNEQPQNIHVAGDFINDAQRAGRIAKRHFASIKNVRGVSDEAISLWLMEITSLLKRNPEFLSNIATGQIEALLWIAIFGSKSEAIPCLDSQLVTACSQLGLKIMIENYTQFDDEGVPKKLWVS